MRGERRDPLEGQLSPGLIPSDPALEGLTGRHQPCDAGELAPSGGKASKSSGPLG